MKLIIFDFANHSNVVIRNAEGINIDSYTFDTHELAVAFCSGFEAARHIAVSQVQSLPNGYERRKGQ